MAVDNTRVLHSHCHHCSRRRRPRGARPRELYLFLSCTAMSLYRRFVRDQYVSTSSTSSTATAVSTNGLPATPRKKVLQTPVAQSTPKSTPRTRIVNTPAPSDPNTPSLSASVPFDWNAARARLPPPYAATPDQRSRRKSTFGTPLRDSTPRPKFVRKKSLYDRCVRVPLFSSRLMANGQCTHFVFPHL